MENQTQTEPAATKEHYENYFDALDSMQFSKTLKLDRFNTNALTEILSEAESKWIASVISSALEEKDEAKQIYSIAESIRLEYIENTVSDLNLLFDDPPVLNARQKEKVGTISDYLYRCVYGIDLFDVAKELLIRHKQRNGEN